MVGVHGVIRGLNKGLCYRRMSWPEGAFIYQIDGRHVDIRNWTGPLTEEDRRRGFITTISHIDMHEPGGHRYIGFEFNAEDLGADDWEEVEVD